VVGTGRNFWSLALASLPEDSYLRVRLRICSRSKIAWLAERTLIVVMPISRAGLRLIPRSSRNTH
jgi:hypothetical protein